jgi:hypothetical protein
MGMARREWRGGRLGVRGMVSLEPLTIRGCGYPDLLATGERCQDATIYDRQHPHDLFMEIAADYDRPLRGSMRWQVYGGLAGEPALGPVAFPHRLSAMPNPIAPMSHHWLDATHISFGVVTGGVYAPRWKAEGSVFNGREPDEARTDLDLGALDSVTGRVWYMPTRNLAIQFSAGHLTEAEAAHGGEPPTDVVRVTASAAYHRGLGEGNLWASTLAWGRNREHEEATQALLAESSLNIRDRETVSARFEIGNKSAHDLGLLGTPEVFTIAKVQLGYTRHLKPWRGFQPGIGGVISTSLVPDPLVTFYSRQGNVGVGVFFTIRPQAH